VQIVLSTEDFQSQIRMERPNNQGYCSQFDKVYYLGLSPEWSSWCSFVYRSSRLSPPTGPKYKKLA